MICMANMLLPGKSAAQKQVEKLEKELERLRRKRPSSQTGRQVFFGDIAKLAKRREPCPTKLNALRKRLMQKHAQKFLAWPLQTRPRYESIALARSTEAARHQGQQRRELIERLVEARRRVQSEGDARPPLQLQAAALGAADLQNIAAKMDSPAFSFGEVLHKRDKACVPPERMSASLAALLDRPLAKDAGGDEPLPAWLAEVARRREHFERTAFCYEAYGETQVAPEAQLRHPGLCLG